MTRLIDGGPERRAPRVDVGTMAGTRPGSPRGRPRRSRWNLALGSAIVALVAGCSPAATASPGASASLGAGCAWPEEVDAYSSNVVLPDTGAAYWLEPFEIAPGLRIVVSGTFPDARYASLEVYTNGSLFTRDGVGSTLTDYQIAPDPGSLNPWQRPAAPGGRYTVTLREDVAAGQVNVIPLAPAGTSSGRGLLVYRVYLPAGGDLSQIRLPTLTLQQAGQPTPHAPCTTFYPPGGGPQAASSAVPSVTPTPTPSPSPSTPAVRQLQFFKATIETLAPNADTQYLLAYLTPPDPGDVVVIRARAPTHASGDHPSPWPSADAEVRYWSMCIGLATGVLPTVMNLAPSGGTDAGCRADDQVTLDASGDYAFVLGTEAQRARIEGIAGTTFLPFAAAQPVTTHLLMLRDMLVSPDFAYSPARVPRGDDPAATEAVMGPYYPQATVCPLSTLAAEGVSGCFK